MKTSATTVSVKPVLSMLATIVVCSMGIHLAAVTVLMIFAAILG